VTQKPSPRWSQCPRAELEWRDAVPASTRYDDIYYSAEGGLEETHHVFLTGNGLPEAWSGRAHSTIGETGFGTGLNFLATWAAWRAHRTPEQRLHFLSFEGFPLTPEEMARALAPWPELDDLAQQLLAQYPKLVPGIHQLDFPDDGISLTLGFGMADDILPSFQAEVDFWFLDGFAPRDNEDMWSLNVFQEMARLSKQGARLATFTVAGAVRRGLIEAGFVVEKVAGHGRKRHMLAGHYDEVQAVPVPLSPQHLYTSSPWYNLAPATGSSDVLVLGAGIGGVCATDALLRSGANVHLMDRHAAYGSEASGNEQAILMPRLSTGPSIEGRFYRATYLHALRFYAQLNAPDCFTPCGVMHLAKGDLSPARLMGLGTSGVLPADMVQTIDHAQAEELSGLDLPDMVTGGAFYPDAGYIRPAALMSMMRKRFESTAGARFTTSVGQAEKLIKDGQAWAVVNAQGDVLHRAESVVLAMGADMPSLAQTDWLPLVSMLGQVTRFEVNAASSDLKCVVAFGHYLMPQDAGAHLTGASYHKDVHDLTVSADDDVANLKALSTLGLEGTTPLSARRSIRAATPDHMPIVGAVPRKAAFMADYSHLTHGDKFHPYPDPSFEEGLYMLGGLGSYGFLTAPFLSASLAALISGSPQPMSREMSEMVCPQRYLIRQLIRGS